MSDDEYDAYNLSLDVEDLPFITSLPPSPPTTGIPSQETRPSQEEETREGDIQDSQDSQSSDLDVFYTAPSTQIDAHHSDSYSDYDLSEFTADDFASFDAAVTDVGESSTGATKRVGAILNNAARAGPAVSVVLEGASKTLRDMGPPGEPPVRKNNGETNVSSHRQMKEASPYERFRSWRGALSVTDLTSPSWCEVQFDYGLRQKRFKKVEERPTEFQTAAGKTIIVDTSVAVVNDLVAERGRSVHKVLERELHPEEIKVETTTEEERWALRLVNMIASMQSLQHAGRCREMHVFGVVNSQIVTGIIDEVERKPVALPPPSLRSSVKRSPNSTAPNTPTNHSAKRVKRSLSPDQLPLTDFFPSTPSRSERTDSQTDMSSSPLLEDKCIQVSSPPHSSGMVLTPSPAEPPALPSPLFKLHLSDTKTRRSASLPKVEDTLSARMQLMLYHRLLSNLLASPAESEDALDFQQIWLRMRLDHRRPFSQTFRDTAGLVLLSNDTNGSAIALNCLDDLTEGWRNLVEALHLSGVDDTLTVVYRTQPKKTRWKNKRSHTPSSADLLATETDDIVRAVIASLDDSLAPACDEQMVEEGLKTMLAEVTSADEPTTSIPSPSPELASGSGDDASLEWAIQQSLLEQVRSRPELKDIVLAGEAETSAPPSPKEKPIEDKERTPEPSESTVIGKKTFQMDEKTLLSYVKSVLDWWYGRRPPKGVDVHLAGRCLSCEYQAGCEWRATKAAEVLEKKGRR